MALGDRDRVQNSIDYQGGLAQNWLNNIRNNLIPQNQNLQNRFQVAADRADSDYSNIGSNYNNIGSLFGNYLQGPGISYAPSNQNFGAYGGYQNFANTGGFSDQDISNIRARSLAPLRATYANAQADLDRRNVLAGGNLANYAAAKAKMARELGYNLADASTNVEAALADQIRQGKLAGLSGMTGIDTSRMGEGLANAAQNLQGQGMNQSRINSLLSGMLQSNQGLASLYSATPGLANMYGNQLNQSNAQMIDTQQLQQALAQMLISGNINRSQLPSNFQQVLGNISGVLNLGGQVLGGLPGLISPGLQMPTNLPGYTMGVPGSISSQLPGYQTGVF